MMARVLVLELNRQEMIKDGSMVDKGTWHTFGSSLRFSSINSLHGRVVVDGFEYTESQNASEFTEFRERKKSQESSSEVFVIAKC